MLVKSHSQACIERGFIVNGGSRSKYGNVLSLVSQRLAYDKLLASGVKFHEYEIPTDLLKTCKSANSRYNQNIAELRNMRQSEEKAAKHCSEEEEEAGGGGLH